MCAYALPLSVASSFQPDPLSSVVISEQPTRSEAPCNRVGRKDRANAYILVDLSREIGVAIPYWWEHPGDKLDWPVWRLHSNNPGW